MDTERLGYCTNCLQKLLLLAQLQVCRYYHFSLEAVYLLLSMILGISWPCFKICCGYELEALRSSQSSSQKEDLFLGFVSLHLLKRTIFTLRFHLENIFNFHKLWPVFFQVIQESSKTWCAEDFRSTSKKNYNLKYSHRLYCSFPIEFSCSFFAEVSQIFWYKLVLHTQIWFA